MSPEAVISLDHLTKRFGGVTAVDDVCCEVARGEVFGFVGPNGSGKSTTIRTILDLLRPSSGRVQVLGVDPRRSGAAERARIGYLPGDLAPWPRMDGRDMFAALARLRGHDPTVRVTELAERFDLDLDRRIGHLSKGNRQKLGVVQAFMHDPELVILDEPSTGLDPLMQLELHALVREWADAGRTVLVSSHVMSEIEAVADRVAIIHQGRLRAVDSVEALRAAQPQRIRATFASTAPREFTVQRPEELRELLDWLGDQDVVTLDAQRGSLEDAFIALLQDDR